MNTRTKVVPLVALGVAALCLSRSAAAPAKDGDPVLIGTVWKGKLTQKGNYAGVNVPADFDCTFTVTARDREKFEAELFEKADGFELTYVVRGTVKPVDAQTAARSYQVEWESVGVKDAKNAASIIKIPYTGVQKDKKLKGTWKHPANNDDTTLEGEFDFELTKKE